MSRSEMTREKVDGEPLSALGFKYMPENAESYFAEGADAKAGPYVSLMPFGDEQWLVSIVTDAGQMSGWATELTGDLWQLRDMDRHFERRDRLRAQARRQGLHIKAQDHAEVWEIRDSLGDVVAGGLDTSALSRRSCAAARPTRRGATMTTPLSDPIAGVLWDVAPLVIAEKMEAADAALLAFLAVRMAAADDDAEADADRFHADPRAALGGLAAELAAEMNARIDVIASMTGEVTDDDAP